jgi:hypothetical protein
MLLERKYRTAEAFKSLQEKKAAQAAHLLKRVEARVGMTKAEFLEKQKALVPSPPPINIIDRKHED